MTEYRELKANAHEIGVAHGLADHSLSEMMLSCERAVGRCVPVDVWLDLFAGWEAGKRERKTMVTVPYVPTDWTDVPL